MDGNGRWGKRKGRNFGHLKGVETVKIVKASIKLTIPIVTFTFSLRKIGKTKKKKLSFKLIKNYFLEVDSIVDQGIKVNILGEIKNFHLI